MVQDVGEPSGFVTLRCWRLDSPIEELLKWRRERTASQEHELAGSVHGDEAQRPAAEDVRPGTDLASAPSWMDLDLGTQGRSGIAQKCGRAVETHQF